MSNSLITSNFTNKYQLFKTLRFELIPQGKTLDHIQNKGLLKRDEERAKSYELMKKTIDGFHKYFIEIAMSQVKLTKLGEITELYNASSERKKEDTYKKELEKVQSDLRKEIVKGFKTGEASEIFSKIDKKELFTELLDNWVKSLEDKNLVDEFKTFTTYFTGFHENRKNMYSDKEQSTAIAYRLIHENLPKFLDNIKIFGTVIDRFGKDKLKVIEEKLDALIQGKPLAEIFSLEYYNEALTQKGIDFINSIIGGYTEEEGKKKIQGLNEYINLYNQPQEKKSRIPKLKILYKQILSDRSSISFLPEAFEDDKEKTASQKVLEAINSYYRENLLCFQSKDESEPINILQKSKELIGELSAYDLNKIYIRNDKAITDISNTIFGDWGIIKSALEHFYLQKIEIGKGGISKKQEADKEKYLKQSYFSIAEIESALFAYRNEVEILKDIKLNTHPIADYFLNHFKAKKQEVNNKEFDLIANIEAKYSCIQGLLNTEYPKDKNLNQEKKTIDDIKAFLDSLMELLHFVKPLALPKDTTLEKEEIFYSPYEIYYEQLQYLIPLYNKVRNYAAKKPYSTEKYKLNFENPELLGGWPVDREIATSSVIFKNDNYYYLGILDKESKRLFKNLPKPKDKLDIFFKMAYLQAADPSKDVQNLMIIDGKTVKKNGRKEKSGEFTGENLLLEKLKNIYLPENVNDIRKSRSYSKLSETFKKEDLVAFINYYKQRTIEYFDSYQFEFKDSFEYKDFGEFTNHINSQAYQINFVEVSKEYIYNLVDEGKLYLFQIYNKDFSQYSKGKPNIHTLYWKALFDSENLKDVVYKLNGQAEVFYRKKSIEKLTVHKANEPIFNKNPNATKKQSTFKYDLVKDKRFTVDKFHFHVPITINFKATGNDYINNDVLDYLKNNPNVNIIGLDRGERHLIYLTLVNQNGEILKQETLNSIIDEQYNIETPYHKLLQTKEDERAKARENWGVIENIKELKEGYISQVVHKIAKMMVEHNAIVVMEDLNTGFKRGRFKVEKQVYQKLEKMLIDKLNYLVFKDKAPNEIGGLYNALQLTNKFKSFKEMGKQSGFLFYVPAWNTSKIDPTTGFVNLFNAKYESIPKAQEFFSKFESIRYNSEKAYFEFAFDYSKFTARAEGTKTKWTVCTHGERIITFRNPDTNNQWDNKEVILTLQFEDLFGKYNIVYGSGTCIKDQIVSQTEKAFFEKLLQLFKLTLQMRNSITNSEVDYLISPVMNGKGEFYDSRKADSTLPRDADANGAYHIAKKGQMWLQQIQNFNGNDWKKLDLDKSNKGWLSFVQKK